MAGKKKANDAPIVKDDPSRILDTSMEDVMHNSMMPYAEHVILDRALPRMEDGLKPVQRRILYTMMELGTTPDKPHRKCARIVGDCLGKYHPHGDSSVYGALVHLAQDFSMRAPLIDGHGNFGSIDGDSAAAMRYTEARMAPLALLMLRDLEKDTVPFRLNFDDTLKEPDMLPSRFPNLLVNGANGIAVGLATNIPPHNLGEAVRAVIAQIDDPDISLDALMRIMPGPDFPTGGILLRNEEIRRGYETGRGKLTLRAKVDVEDGSAGRKLIVISEVPYQVNKASLLEKIQKLSEEKKAVLSGIYDIRDESDRTGMRAVIELRRDADPARILAYLYKYSDLQVTFGVNMVAIAGGKPVQLSLKGMIAHYIDYQKEVVTRRTRFELNQAKARAHILEGLMIALDNLDEVIALIRASKSPKEAKAGLMERFSLSDVQAQAILDMRLQRLTNLEVMALRKEYAEILKLIARLEGILKSEKKLLTVIKTEMSEIADQYADDRRTAFEEPSDAPAEMPEEVVTAEDAVIVFTQGGYLKRISPLQLKKTPLPSSEENPADSPRFLLSCTTAETLYFLTDKGNCYPLSVGKLAEIRPRDRGQLLSGVLADIEDDEHLLLLLSALPADMAGKPDLLFVTEKGTVKRSAAAEYAIRSKKFPALALKGDDRLIQVLPLESGADLLLITENGMSIRFPESAVPVQGRTAGGVKGIGLEAGDRVIWAGQLHEKEELVLFSDRGWGKRIPQIDFEVQNRAGRGVRCFAFNKNGASGRAVAAVWRGREDAQVNLMISQARSPVTVLPKNEILLQAKSGRGMPYVMAILDDVITGIIGVEIKSDEVE